MDERRARQWLTGGVIAVVAGIGLSAAELEGVGSWLTVGGLALTLAGLHRFGRSGADAG